MEALSQSWISCLYYGQRTQPTRHSLSDTEKMATYGKQDDEEKQTKTHHNMCWTPLYANKHE
jgi:hypothetical protein